VRLTDLGPKFLTVTTPLGSFFTDGTDIAVADGLLFLCPVCFKTNAGPIGTHSIICWRPRIPQTIGPTPGRWEMLGTGFDDLTLRAGSSSVFLQGPGCGAHFFITNGEIVGV
jgi:hypothetical protein